LKPTRLAETSGSRLVLTQLLDRLEISRRIRRQRDKHSIVLVPRQIGIEVMLDDAAACMPRINPGIRPAFRLA